MSRDKLTLEEKAHNTIMIKIQKGEGKRDKHGRLYVDILGERIYNAKALVKLWESNKGEDTK